MLKSVFLIVLITAVLACGSLSQADEPTGNRPAATVYQPKFYPFEAGEKAVYKASWNGISVATAEVNTVPVTIDGRRFVQVQVDAKTSRVIDFLWKMRDTITSTFEAKTLSPFRFVFNQRENSRAIDTDAKYHAVAGKWAVDRRQNGKKPTVYEFESQNTLDPITAAYLARSIEIKPGDKLRFNVFGGRYQYLLELAVNGKENVELESGKVVEAFKVIPKVTNLSKKGYAGRMNEAAIWISADERRIPVKLTSKLFVGSVQLELVQDKVGLRSASAEDAPPSS